MIELSAPERLWWLAGLALLLLFAVPPRPQREELTAHLPQWTKALQRCHRTPLRFPWLRTLLGLLAFAAAVLAWTGPRVPAVPGPTRLRVVVDASASLLADGAEGVAFARLRTALERGLGGLPPHVRAATLIVRCDRDLHLVEDVADLGEPQRTGLGVDLDRVAATAAGPDTAVWTLTDGMDGVPTTGALTRVGVASQNLAITDLRVDDRWPLPDVEVEVEVANFSGSERTVLVELAGADGVLAEIPAAQPLTLPAGARERVLLALRRERGGRLAVALTQAGDVPTDALPADDRVACVLPGPPAPRIAVLSDSEAPVLRKAAQALAAEAGGDVVDVGAAGSLADYVLVEGGTQRASDWGSARGVLFGTRLEGGSGGGGSADEPALAGAAVEWDRRHPLTAGLDLSELRVVRTSAAVAGHPLVTIGGRPVVALRGDGRLVHCAFRLTDANLWLLAAFPQFLRRAYATAHAEAAAVRLLPDNLVDARESDLRSPAVGEDRPLPAFGAPPRDLTAWFALVALACLLARTLMTRAG